MSIAYRYIDGGFLEQEDANGVWSVHMLNAAEKALFDANAPQYAPLVQLNAARVDMIEAPIWAVGFGESGWKQPASITFDGGIGLMQITSAGAKQGLSNDQVWIPENNIKLGSDLLAKLSQKYEHDIVRMASGYNCGSAKAGSGPWGYCEYKIPSTGAYPYISKVVRAYNYALANPPGGGGGVAPGGGAGAGDVVESGMGTGATLLATIGVGAAIYFGLQLVK